MRRRKDPRSYDVEIRTGVIRKYKAFLVTMRKEERETDYEQFVGEPDLDPERQTSRSREMRPKMPGGTSAEPASSRANMSTRNQEQNKAESSIQRKSSRVKKIPDQYNLMEYK